MCNKKLYRTIMESVLGKPLSVHEIIHHIDGNHKNNAISNLKIMTAEEHSSLHSAGRRGIKQKTRYFRWKSYEKL